MSNPIFALSTAGGKITYATGVAVHDEIRFLKMETISGIFRSWREIAKEKLAVASEKGMTIIVEDAQGLFPEYLSIDLGALDVHENRTYQNIALDRYIALASAGESATIKTPSGPVSLIGALAFSSKVVAHAIRPNQSILNVEYDEKGRPKYDLETSLTGQQRCLLLITLSVGGIVVHDDQFADAIFDELSNVYGSLDGDQYTTPAALRSLLARTDSIVDVSDISGDSHGV